MYFSAASVAKTPKPPPLVTIREFDPLGKRVLEMNFDHDKACCIVSALIMPCWRAMASKTRSSPDNEPVWDLAAWAPFFDLPDLMTITGFLSPVCCAVLMKRSPSVIPSRYIRMALVDGSSLR